MGAVAQLLAAVWLAAGPLTPATVGSLAPAATGSIAVTTLAQSGALGLSGVGDPENRVDWHARGSLVTYHPLPAGANGLRVSAGFALALPFVGFEYGRGLGGNAQFTAHYEGVVGLLHFFDVGARWAPFDWGPWRVGFGLGAAYSFFGLASDNTSLTSTLYLTPEVGGSVFLGTASELVLAAGVEVDVLEWVVLDGASEADAQVRLDAVLVRFGWRTRLADELDVYVLGRLRIPTETFAVEDEQFSFVPYAEFGGTWSF